MSSTNIPVLNVLERTESGSAASRRARKSGRVPAVMYGHGEKPHHLLVDSKEWSILARTDAHIIELKFEDGKSLNALIKEVQREFLKTGVKHIDFLEVKMDEVIISTVAVHPDGTPAGISQGGILDQAMHEIEVSCKATDLPDSITIDVSALNLDDIMHVGELTLPAGVTATSDADLSVFHVIQAIMQEEETEEEVEVAEGAETPEASETSGDTAAE